jgi:hypothetical protein
MKKGLVYTEFGTELIPNPEVYKTMDKTKCEHYLKTCAECAIDFQPCVGVEKCEKPRQLSPDVLEKWIVMREFCKENGYVPTEREANHLNLEYSKVVAEILLKDFKSSLEHRIEMKIEKYIKFCEKEKIDPYLVGSAKKYRNETGTRLYQNSTEYMKFEKVMRKLLPC